MSLSKIFSFYVSLSQNGFKSINRGLQHVSNLNRFTIKIWNERKEDYLGTDLSEPYLLDKTLPSTCEVPSEGQARSQN